MEHGPTHLAPARLVVAGPPRPQRVAPSTGLGANDLPPAVPPTGIRRRLILDAAILLGAAAGLVLAVSIVAPTGPTGGVLGITTDGMATAGTIIGPGPAATGAPSTRPAVARPTAGAPAAAAVDPHPNAGGAGVPPGASSGPGLSAASLADLAPCPNRADCYLYVVRRGDNLTRIAVRFGVPASVILAMNPTIVDPSIIVTGSTLRIPTPTR